MKQGVVFAFLFVSLVAFGSDPELLGKWENKKYQVSYLFKADSSIVFEQMGYPVFVDRYSLDTTKKPQLLIMTVKQGPREVQIPALVEFVDAKTIKIEQFAPYNNPTHFSEEADGGINKVHVLTRVE